MCVCVCLCMYVCVCAESQPNTPSFGSAAARQEVVEERGAAGTDVGVEAAYCEHTQAVQHGLGGAGDVCEETLCGGGGAAWAWVWA